jgi:hypothetical protein
MTAARAGVLVGALALLVASTAGAANVAGTTYVDKGGGYSITIPKNWQLVPRTVPKVKALAARLAKKKSTADLGKFYMQLISTAQGRRDLTAYRFQAFDWPASLSQPIPVEASVGVVVGKKAYGPKDLPAIGAVFANAFASNKGAKVTTPRTVALPVGQASLVEAVIPVGGGVANGVELYLIPRGKLLYELSFQIESSQLPYAKLFTSIAEHFKFTK